MSEIRLSPSELEAATDYDQSTKQLEVLHKRGFVRAYIGRRGGVILERAHYEAVCTDQFGKANQSSGKPGIMLDFLKKMPSGFV